MSYITCDLVNSTQRNPKTIVHGYLLVKDKNRGEKYYWCCDFDPDFDPDEKYSDSSRIWIEKKFFF
ncbi:hypothetical protein RhiirA5_447396 [Rhizophagus irregularis]|uniref:Uncharacterized protein n=1 Tax=Rhizophagus irregularis TaxID=588596 RepID=A0A2N0NB95_9GLOM|nr:hypothetical protein RhiirA5_447396 [Rhizophagus irregularis]